MAEQPQMSKPGFWHGIARVIPPRFFESAVGRSRPPGRLPKQATCARVASRPALPSAALPQMFGRNREARTEGFGAILGRVANIAAYESILTDAGKADAKKTGKIPYDSFSSSHFTLGEKVGKAFGDGRALL